MCPLTRGTVECIASTQKCVVREVTFHHYTSVKVVHFMGKKMRNKKHDEMKRKFAQFASDNKTWQTSSVTENKN